MIHRINGPIPKGRRSGERNLHYLDHYGSSTIFEAGLADASGASWVRIRSRKARPFGRPFSRVAPSWVRKVSASRISLSRVVAKPNLEFRLP